MSNPRPVGTLPPRVMHALAIYAECWSAKDTARRLGVSYGTVKKYLVLAHREYDVETTGEVFVALGWLRTPCTSGHCDEVA